jgi:hypothetical protein
VRREFSTRRRQIEQALDQAPAKGVTRRARQLAAQAACLVTRPTKRHQSADELRQQWVERATAAGFGPDQLSGLLDLPTTSAVPVPLDDVVARALSSEGVTREATTFRQGALLRELIGQLPPGAPTSTHELLAATADAVGTNHVVPVITADGRAYTTVDLLETEASTFALATRGGSLARLDRAQVAAAVAQAADLRTEQKRVAFELLTSGRPVDVVTGPAGCGKTAGLALATEVWRAGGHEVAGTAVAALTAQGLERASRAPGVSLARTVGQPDRHIPRGGVLLVDEAGMIGTRQLHLLLSLAADRDCKVVLVGDLSSTGFDGGSELTRSLLLR